MTSEHVEETPPPAAAGEVELALDFHERPMHCHHEKLIIVDGEVAFVGGTS